MNQRRSEFQISSFPRKASNRRLAPGDRWPRLEFYREILMRVLARPSLAPSNVFLPIRDRDSCQRSIAGIAFALNLFLSNWDIWHEPE